MKTSMFACKYKYRKWPIVDGISFIEKLSFNAFNEGTRVTHCIKMHKRLLGVDVKKIGGDASSRHGNGRLVRNAEGALFLASDQG